MAKNPIQELLPVGFVAVAAYLGLKVFSDLVPSIETNISTRLATVTPGGVPVAAGLPPSAAASTGTTATTSTGTTSTTATTSGCQLTAAQLASNSETIAELVAYPGVPRGMYDPNTCQTYIATRITDVRY